MKPFLQHIAEEITKNHKDKIDQLCIVLPNRRGGLFLKKYLAKSINKTFWAPEILSIEDFILKYSGLYLAEPVTLLSELFEVYKKETGDTAQPFEQFIYWGQSILEDFNEIDLYNQDAKHVFSYLDEAKVLENWNLNRRPLTDLQKNYLLFYKSLYQLYIGLNNRLKSQKLAYQGMAYKTVVKNIDEIIKNIEYHKIIFAGFNALTSTEEIIIKQFINEGKATIYWDADDYYTNDKKQEAGNFLRKYKKDEVLGRNFSFSEHFKEKKKINITGVTGNIAQAKYSGEILNAVIDDKTEKEKIAVVLGDENLLIPVLHSLPEKIDPFNVTMGLPLKSTPLFDLFKSLIDMHINATRLKETRHNKYNLFYHKDVIKLLRHPYISGFFEEKVLRSINNNLVRKNRVLLQLDDIRQIFAETSLFMPEICELVFAEWKDTKVSLENLYSVTELLKEHFIEQNKNPKDEYFELEYLFAFSKVFNKVSDLHSEYHNINSLKTLQTLINQLARTIKLPFYGEPLLGVQIMGMLETRTLDFETIILLSANEGIIPSGKNMNSFIPFDIKYNFGLPTYREKDAIFAYHFYRLVQRAKNIHILYNTNSNSLGGGDKSRFITQILHEIHQYNPEIVMKESILHIPMEKQPGDIEIEIKKDEKTIQKLNKIAERGFSPSALNSFISCSLQYYFRYIAGIDETEEVEETIDAATMGTVIHDVLNDLFSEYTNQYLQPAFYDEMQKKVDAKTTEKFNEVYTSGNTDFGKNLLIKEVSKKFIQKYLRKEKEEVKNNPNQKRRIIQLEENLKTNLEITGIGSVNFKGKADRIDEINGETVVIDYKSGSVTQTELNTKALDDILESKKSKAFQLIMYAWLYSKSVQNHKDISAGIISMRKLNQGLIRFNINNEPSIDQSKLNKFESILIDLINKLFDINLPFKQTEEIKDCEYCPFKLICNR
jgi:ATP-dependent helicase/nuclease subunit B